MKNQIRFCFCSILTCKIMFQHLLHSIVIAVPHNTSTYIHEPLLSTFRARSRPVPLYWVRRHEIGHDCCATNSLIAHFETFKLFSPLHWYVHYQKSHFTTSTTIWNREFLHSHADICLQETLCRTSPFPSEWADPLHGRPFETPAELSRKDCSHCTWL